jgi:hypothetical protein
MRKILPIHKRPLPMVVIATTADRTEARRGRISGRHRSP